MAGIEHTAIQLFMQTKNLIVNCITRNINGSIEEEHMVFLEKKGRMHSLHGTGLECRYLSR